MYFLNSLSILGQNPSTDPMSFRLWGVGHKVAAKWLQILTTTKYFFPMFKKIFRPLPSVSKTEPEIVTAEDALAAAEYKPPEKELTLRARQTTGPVIGTSDRKESLNLSSLPHIDPLDITIEDLDPYSDQHKVRRSKSFSFHPTPKPDPSFKLPRSKSVHFADQIGRKNGILKSIWGGSAAPEDSSLVYSESLADPSKEAHENLNHRLQNMFGNDESEGDATKHNLQNEASVFAHDESKKEELELEASQNGTTIDYDEESPSQILWDQTDELSGELLPENDVYRKLSSIYLKYFSSLPLESGDVSEIIQSLDTGIGETIQESNYCKALLVNSENRVKGAEEEAEVWKDKFFEADKEFAERQRKHMEDYNNLELEFKRSTEEAFAEIEKLNKTFETLQAESRKRNEEFEMQTKDYEVVLQQNSVLLQEKESASIRVSNAVEEKEILKQRLKEIETSFLVDLKAKDTELSALKSECQKLKLNVASKVEEIDQLNAERNDLASKLESSQCKVETLQEAKLDLENKVNVRVSNYKELEECNLDLRKNLDLYEAECISFETQITKFKTRISNLDADLMQSQLEKEQATQEKLKIHELLETLQKQIAKNNEELGSFKCENDKALEQLKALKLDLGSKNEQLEILKAEKARTEDELSKQVALVAKLTNEVAKRRSDFKTCFDACQKLQWSNRFVVDSSRRLLKSTYEALAPVFLPQSASDYAQAYYEFIRIGIFSPENQMTLTNLSTELIGAVRQMVKLYAEAHDAIAAEKVERIDFQKTSMAAITKMARYCTQKKLEMPTLEITKANATPREKNLKVSDLARLKKNSKGIKPAGLANTL